MTTFSTIVKADRLIVEIKVELKVRNNFFFKKNIIPISTYGQILVEKDSKQLNLVIYLQKWIVWNNTKCNFFIIWSLFWVLSVRLEPLSQKNGGSLEEDDGCYRKRVGLEFGTHFIKLERMEQWI
jgi:hypothetical protein